LTDKVQDLPKTSDDGQEKRQEAQLEERSGRRLWHGPQLKPRESDAVFVTWDASLRPNLARQQRQQQQEWSSNLPACEHGSPNVHAKVAASLERHGATNLHARE